MEHEDGLIGFGIDVPPDETYRTCSECGGDCYPDPAVGTNDIGARIAFVCPEHGINSVVDPFDGLRR